MDKQRKDDIKAAVDIDTTADLKNFRENIKFGNRIIQDQAEWNNRFVRFFYYVLDSPARYVYEKINELRSNNRPIYYHKKFNRVPTIDECYTDDFVCIYEADQQLKRDRMVDDRILAILKERYTHCITYHGHDDGILCEKIRNDANQAEYNLEVKYGELDSKSRAIDAYMKQKHRLILERRKKLLEQKDQPNDS